MTRKEKIARELDYATEALKKAEEYSAAVASFQLALVAARQMAQEHMEKARRLQEK